MPNLLFIAGFLTLTLWACCLQAQTVAAEDEAMVRSEIDALVGEMTASAEQLSTAALQKYLSDDPQDSFFLGNQEFSKAELLAQLQKLYEPNASQSIKIIKSGIRVLSVDYAIWKAEMQSTVTQKDDKILSMNLKETWLWHKGQDGWRVVHYHESW